MQNNLMDDAKNTMMLKQWIKHKCLIKMYINMSNDNKCI